MFGLKWKCAICGQKHDDVPTCFGIDAPWRAFVPEHEFDQRVELTKSLCVVDGEQFFIRGHVEIPIIDHDEPFVFSVWSSLSEESFVTVNERWEAPDRANDPPYFGWLCSPIIPYGDCLHLPLSVQTREPGLVPHFMVISEDHPLSIDQNAGISRQTWHEMALKLLA
jgi:hypothetical protein